MKDKIPKIIHYCWYGGRRKKELEIKCLNSWKKYCPDYEKVEWNEERLAVQKFPEYIKDKYEKKVYGLVSDYIRYYALKEQGGIYLDLDAEVIKNLDPLLKNEFFACYESNNLINTAVMGSHKNHFILKKGLDYISGLKEMEIAPTVFTNLYNGLSSNQKKRITVFPNDFFYPFAYCEKFTPECITQNTYIIHWWAFSWNPKKLRNAGLGKFIKIHATEIFKNIIDFLKKI